MADINCGVPLNQLYCPTCGHQFRDFRLHTEEDEFSIQQFVSPIKAFATGNQFLLCPNAHRWSVKMIWRRTNYPDRIQLDRYLGTD